MVPSVTVACTNVRTGVARTTVTNDQGLYSVPALESGVYEITVSLTGFTSLTRRDVPLAVGSTITLDFALELAGLSENVTVVQTAAPLIETTRSEVKAILRANEVENLPLLNRNYTGLVALLPGAKVAKIHDVTKNTIGGISINGSAGRNINTLVDGGDNRDDVNGGVLMNFTVEGVEEFKLSTQRFSAAEGRTAGGSLTIITKSGTNNVHGSTFVFGRDAAFAARDYFSKKGNLAEPPFTRQAFGGAFGGPIVRNRVFYFGAIERTRQNTSLTMSNKAFSELKLLESVGLAKPTQQMPRPLRDLTYTGKVNVNFSDAHSMFARVAQQRTGSENNGADSANRDRQVTTFDRQRAYSVLGSLTSIVSPRALNQLTIHKNFWSFKFDSKDFPGVERNLIFPSVQAGRGSTNAGQDNLVSKAQIKDDFTALWGTHQLQFGGDFSWYQKDFGIVASFPADGSLTFFDDPSTILSDKVRYPQGLQTSGAVRLFQQATPDPIGADGRVVGAKQIAGYLQDDWRATSRLTLNLGLRYDVTPNFMNEREYANSRTYLALKAIGSPFGRLPQTDTNDFSPRVGFAYSMRGGKTVLRGGYGKYYDTNTVGFIFRAAQQMKTALSVVGTKTNTAIGVGELASYRYLIDPPPTVPLRITELPRGGRSTGQWMDPSYRDPESQQFNLGLSHELKGSLVLSTEFVHSLGRYEATTEEINWILPNGLRRLAPAFGVVLGDPDILGSISLRSADSASQFDMLNVKLERLSSRAGYQVRYELTRAMGYYGQIAGRGGLPQDQNNRFAAGEWGPSENEERHRVVFYGVFELPFGLQVSPIFQAATPRAYNLTAGRDLNRDGVNNDLYVDPATGQTVRINSGRGDPIVAMDLRTTRFFNLGSGSKRLSVFAEFFNLLNTVNFGNNYSGSATSALFKQPVGLMQGIGDPFQAQFGARFIF